MRDLPFDYFLVLRTRQDVERLCLGFVAAFHGDFLMSEHEEPGSISLHAEKVSKYEEFNDGERRRDKSGN